LCRLSLPDALPICGVVARSTGADPARSFHRPKIRRPFPMTRLLQRRYRRESLRTWNDYSLLGNLAGVLGDADSFSWKDRRAERGLSWLTVSVVTGGCSKDTRHPPHRLPVDPK